MSGPQFARVGAGGVTFASLSYLVAWARRNPAALAAYMEAHAERVCLSTLWAISAERVGWLKLGPYEIGGHERPQWQRFTGWEGDAA